VASAGLTAGHHGSSAPWNAAGLDPQHDQTADGRTDERDRESDRPDRTRVSSAANTVGASAKTRFSGRLIIPETRAYETGSNSSYGRTARATAMMPAPVPKSTTATIATAMPPCGSRSSTNTPVSITPLATRTSVIAGIRNARVRARAAAWMMPSAEEMVTAGPVSSPAATNRGMNTSGRPPLTKPLRLMPATRGTRRRPGIGRAGIGPASFGAVSSAGPADTARCRGRHRNSASAPASSNPA